jgi:putative transposase
MPRVARVVVPGIPHHVTQRGNNRQHVFFTDDDRRFYLGGKKMFSVLARGSWLIFLPCYPLHL